MKKGREGQLYGMAQATEHSSLLVEILVCSKR